MNIDLIMAIASTVAVFISLAAYLHSRRTSSEQNRLTVRETEYVRLMIDRERREHAKSLEADVSARLTKEGKNDWRLKIYNRGPAPAHNVKMEILHQNSFFEADWVDEKLPVATLEPQHTVSIHAFVHSGKNHSQEDVKLFWSDGSEMEKQKTVTVTL
ncbi:MAG: hypothetical protein QNJ09_04790 [Paracoccaceae bacterium]|nr:hypothetical protein [Paracoccaceae bacterium]